jgi:hypothetical protein
VLTITNISAANTATNSVVVTSVYGSMTSSNAFLQVISAPQITAPPSNATNGVGNAVTFIVTNTAVGGSSNTYYWSLETPFDSPTTTNLLVAGGGGGTVAVTASGQCTMTNFGSTNSILTITNLTLGNAGKVGVVVSNAAGIVSTVLTPANLWVADVQITSQPVSTTNYVGSNVTFSVTVAAQPTNLAYLTYQWRWNGSDMMGEVNNVLQLNNLFNSDAGTYTVVVSNSGTFFGAVTSSPAVLTVLSPVVITRQPTDTNVYIGQPVSFSVDVSGTPPFAYQWQTNGVNIPGAISRFYTIPAVGYSNQASYHVIVTSGPTSVTSSNAMLRVQTLNPLTLTLVKYTNNVAMLQVQADAGLPVALRASRDFTNWTWLTTNTAPYYWYDTNAGGVWQYRFYKAQTPY